MNSELNLNQSQLEGIELTQAIEQTGLEETGVREILAQFGFEDANNPELQWIPLPYAGMLLELSNNESEQQATSTPALPQALPESNGHQSQKTEETELPQEEIFGIPIDKAALLWGMDVDDIRQMLLEVDPEAENRTHLNPVEVEIIEEKYRELNPESRGQLAVAKQTELMQAVANALKLMLSAQPQNSEQKMAELGAAVGLKEASTFNQIRREVRSAAIAQGIEEDSNSIDQLIEQVLSAKNPQVEQLRQRLNLNTQESLGKSKAVVAVSSAKANQMLMNFARKTGFVKN
jgi:hypothetical protein